MLNYHFINSKIRRLLKTIKTTTKIKENLNSNYHKYHDIIKERVSGSNNKKLTSSVVVSQV